MSVIALRREPGSRRRRPADHDRLANLLLRLEAVPPMGRVEVRFAPGQPRPIHLIIDGETWGLTRAEADDAAAALFADPGVMTDAVGLAAALMAAGRGEVADNDNDPVPARPIRTGLSGLGLAAVALFAYLAVAFTTVVDTVAGRF